MIVGTELGKPGADRASMLVEYSPLAQALVRRFRHSARIDEDLYQVAMWALLDAYDRFDPQRGEFRSFAAATIIGRLQRHAHDREWAINVPRHLRDRSVGVRTSVRPWTP